VYTAAAASLNLKDSTISSNLKGDVLANNITIVAVDKVCLQSPLL
jgi:hypothetical protein